MATSIGSLFLELRLDTQSYQQALENARSQAQGIGKQIESNLNLNPKVDHRELTRLNEHLSLKQKHFKEVQQDFDRNPLRPRVDLRELRSAQNEIKEFYRLSKAAQSVSQSNRNNTTAPRQKIEVEINADEIAKAIKKGMSGGGIGKMFSDIFSAPFRVATEAGKRIFFGAFEGIGAELSKDIGSGLKLGLERELGGYLGSFKLLGRKLGEGFAQELVEALGDELDAVKPIFEEVLGKANVVQESAAVRSRAAQQQKQTREAASEQLVAEAQFFSNNREGIKTRVARLDKRRESAQQVRRSLNDKVQTAAESLGVKGLEERLQEVRDRRQELADSLSNETLNSSQVDAVSSKISSLSRTYQSISDEIDNLNRTATKKFQADFDRLADIEEKLRREERGLMNIIEAPQRLDYAVPTAKNRQAIAQQQRANLPQVYRNLAFDVAKRSGTKLDESQIPMLRIDQGIKDQSGFYDPKRNEIRISPDLKKALDQGLTIENVEVLAHELRHAAQFGYGKIKDITGQADIDLISPTQKESRQLGRMIERSSAVGTNPEARRKLEADAYVFAARNREEFFTQAQRQQAISKLEGAIGVGGGKAELNINRAAIAGVDKISKIAKSSPVDVQEEVERAVSNIQGISGLITNQLDKLVDIDLMNVDAIEEIQAKILKSVELGVTEIVATTNKFKQSVLEKPEKLLAQSRELLPTFSRKQLNNIATDLGVDYKGKSKRDLQNELLGVEISQLSPKVLEVSRQRAQSMAMRQERMSDIAQGAGQFARSAIDAGQGAMNVGRKALSGTGNAMRQGYAIAQGAEDIALGVLPGGRSGKSLLKNVILPSAGFAALTHYAPGGQMLAEGAGSLVHQGVNSGLHLAQSGIGNALSNAPWAVQMAAKPITTLANWGVGAAQPIAESVLTTLLGGRAIGGIGNAAMKPLKMPLKMPQRQLEPVYVEQKQLEQQSSKAIAALSPIRLNQETSKTLSQVSSIVRSGQVDEGAIERVKAIGEYFSSTYKDLKNGLKQGAFRAAEDAQKFIRAAEHAQKDIDSVIAAMKASGVDTAIGSELGSKLQGLKGQISRKRNLIESQAIKSKPAITIEPDSTIDEEGLFAFGDIRKQLQQRINRVVGRQKDPEEIIHQNLANQARFDLGEMQVNQKYEKATSGANQALERLESNTETTWSRIKRIFAAESNQDWFKGLTGSIRGVSAAFLGLTAFGFIAPLLGQIGKASLAVGLEFDSLGRRLNFIEGSSAKGAEKLRSLKAEADELGVSFRESAKAYAQFASTTEGTSFEGFQTADLANKVKQAASTRGLNAEQQNRLTLGVTQMLGKGKVSQEELRQQIAEVLPGFTQTAARSQGVSVAELNRMITSGMDSAPFLSKAFSQYSAENIDLIESGADSAQAAINRLDNAIVSLQATVGAGLLPGVKLATEVAAGGVNLLANNIGMLMQALTAAAATAGTFALQGLASMIQYNGGLIATLKMLIPSFAALKGAIAAVLPIALRFAAIMAALEIFKLVKTAMSDASGQFGEFAEASTKGLKKYEEALAKANGKQQDFIKNLPKKGSDIEGASYLEDFFGLGNVLPKDLLRKVERGFIAADNATIDKLLPESMRSKSRPEKENDDRMAKLNEFLKADTLTKVDDQLSGRRPETQRLQQINLQLEQVRAERDAIAASRIDLNQPNPQLEALKSREQELLKQYDQNLAPVAAIREQLAARIEMLQKTQEALSELQSNKAITQDEYAQKTKETAEELEKAKAKQDSFNKSLRDLSSGVGAFQKNIQRITDRSADKQREAEFQGNVEAINIANTELSGAATRGQTDFTQQKKEQAKIRKMMDAKRAEYDQITAVLQAFDANSLLAAYKVTGETSVAELKRKAEDTSDNRAKEFLNTLAQQRELEGQIAQGEAELAGQLVQTSRTIADSNKTLNDYYRGIARQIEDINASIKAKSLEIKSLNLQSRVDEALTGIRKTLVSDFGDAIVNLFDSVNQKGQNLNNALNAQTQINRRNQDAALQAQDLVTGLPGTVTGGAGGATGARVPFKGIQVTSAVDASGEPGLDYVVNNGQRGANFGSLTGGKVIFTENNPVEYHRDKGDKRRSYGNNVVVRTTDSNGQKIDVLYAHLDKIAVKLGDIVDIGTVLGTQGRTGSTTGAHVSVDFYREGGGLPGGGGGTTPAALAMRDRLARELANGAGNLNRQAQAPRQQTQTSTQVNTNAGKGGNGSSSLFLPVDRTAQSQAGQGGAINLNNFFAGGSNSLAAKVIGMAEGNRTASGGFTDYAKGHIDPNNDKHNIGSFSAQGSLNRGSIAASDEAVINELLKPYASKLAQEASRIGVKVTPKLLLNYLDTLNQGGSQVVTGWNDRTKGSGFLGKLSMIKGRENDDEAIRKLRVESYRNTSGRLETTFASESALSADQKRRMSELNRAQSAYGLGKSQAGASGATQGSIASNVNELNGALRSLGQAGQAEATTDMAYANAQNRQIDASTLRKYEEARMSLNRSTDEEARNARNQYESVENQMRGIGFETPEKTAKFKAIDITRGARDQLEQLKERIEEGKDRIKELDAYEKLVLDQVKQGNITKDKAAPILAQLKSTRDATTKVISKYKDTEKLIKQAEKAALDDNAMKEALSLVQRENEFLSQLRQYDSKRFQLEAEEASRRGDPRGFIQFQKSAKESDLRSFVSQENQSIESKLQAGLAADKVELLRAGLAAIEKMELRKITNEARELNRSLDIASKNEIFESVNKVGDAEIQGLQILGLDRFAKDFEREKTLAQERFAYAAEMERINEAVAAQRLDPLAANVARENTDIAFNKKIDNVKRQYSELNEIIATNKGAFQEFFTGLINGTESFGSAFGKLVQSIANNLASMASQFLTDELIGLLTGKSKNANQQDAQKLYGEVSPAITYDKQGRELAIAAEDGGIKFANLSQQAGQHILESAVQFANTIASASPIGTESVGLSEAITSAQAPDIFDPRELFMNAEKASYTIADGVKVASGFLADSGTKTSNNLLSGLGQGLPGIFQGILGMIDGKGGGGGFTGILGSLLGGLFGGGGGGGVPDIASPILSLVPNFKDGGFVSDDRGFIDGDLFKRGNNPIAQAVRREGNGAIVGVMNKGEYVLTPPEAQMFFAMGFDRIVKGKVPNFKSGGMVGTGSASRMMRGQAIDITVPVTVSEGSNVDPQKLGESIRSAVQNEISRQQRPGGQLY